jgi:hypothetical protein
MAYSFRPPVWGEGRLERVIEDENGIPQYRFLATRTQTTKVGPFISPETCVFLIQMSYPGGEYQWRPMNHVPLALMGMAYDFLSEAYARWGPPNLHRAKRATLPDTFGVDSVRAVRKDPLAPEAEPVWVNPRRFD